MVAKVENFVVECENATWAKVFDVSFVNKVMMVQSHDRVFWCIAVMRVMRWLVRLPGFMERIVKPVIIIDIVLSL